LASDNPHRQFDGLDIWLTPAEVCSIVLSLFLAFINHHQDENGIIPDSYDVKSSRGERWLALTGSSVMPRITFHSKSFGQETIPAPDPKIIALHAACANIARMSAAAEHLEVVFRHPEQLRVLTDDGTFCYERFGSARYS
jgi:hypothetical protein